MADGMRNNTIAELIESLQDLIDQGIDPATEVRLGSDYGDICHTHQALEVRDVRLATLEDSGYSQSGMAVVEPNEDEDEENESPDDHDTSEQVVLITSVRGN